MATNGGHSRCLKLCLVLEVAKQAHEGSLLQDAVQTTKGDATTVR